MKTTLYRCAMECSFGPPMLAILDHSPRDEDYHLIDTVEVDLPDKPTRAQMLEAITRSKRARNQKDHAA